MRRHRPEFLYVLSLITPILAIACVSSGNRPGNAAHDPIASGSQPAEHRSVLTNADLEQMRDRSVYDALQHVRPTVLQPGSPSGVAPAGRYADVYLDNQFVGDVAFLRTLYTPALRVC